MKLTAQPLLMIPLGLIQAFQLGLVDQNAQRCSVISGSKGLRVKLPTLQQVAIQQVGGLGVEMPRIQIRRGRNVPA
jgi:hypothetical protein